MLVDAAARQEDLVSLERYGPLAKTSAERYEHLYFLAVSNRASGVASRLKQNTVEAKIKLDLALEQFQELGARWQQGTTQSELGKLAASQGDAGQALAHYQQAKVLFVEMKAIPDIERTNIIIEDLSSLA